MRGVDGDVHQLRAVLQRPELGQVEPRRAGVRRLPAEDAVELDGVADRLVDLQGELLGARGSGRSRRSGTTGAVSSSRASDADPGGVALEVELLDELPAAGAELAARGGPGAALGLVLADRGGLMPGAALADVLVDAVALAGDEPLLGVPERGTGPRPGRRRARASSVVARTSRSPLSTAAPRTGRPRTSLAHEPVTGLARHHAATLARDQRAGRGDLGGAGAGVAQRPARRGRARRRSPSPSRPARARRCRSRRPGGASRPRRCGPTSTRGAGASPGRRRTWPPRRAPPGLPPRRHRTRSCTDPRDGGGRISPGPGKSRAGSAAGEADGRAEAAAQGAGVELARSPSEPVGAGGVGDELAVGQRHPPLDGRATASIWPGVDERSGRCVVRPRLATGFDAASRSRSATSVVAGGAVRRRSAGSSRANRTGWRDWEDRAPSRP